LITQVSGCGTGGTVTYAVGLAARNLDGFGMAGGPSGQVVVGTGYALASGLGGAYGNVVSVDVSGVSTVVASPTEAGSAPYILVGVGVDPLGDVLYSYAGTEATTSISGFARVGPGCVAQAFNWALLPPGPPTMVSVEGYGGDAAGDFFVEVHVSSPGNALGTGDRLLRYDALGGLASNIATPPGYLAGVGPQGHLFFGSTVTGTTDVGCGTVGTAGVASFVLAERDQTGACLWSKALPSTIAFALDAADDVLLATTFTGTVDLGGGPIQSVGTADLALAKLDASGNLVWSKSFGAAGASVELSAFGTDSTGGPVLAATLGGAVSFGCGAVGSASGTTTLFASFDPSGAVRYSRVATLPLPLTSFSSTVDGLGGLVLGTSMLPSEQGYVVLTRLAP
jgi:hypothetical protein